MVDGKKKGAPTLYGIITVKLVKGLLFFLLAWVAYAHADNDLPAEYRSLLHGLHLNPENLFFSHLAIKIGAITEANVLWVAFGTLVYSLFSLVEGVGLIFRVSWASWMAIGESAFFIPLECLKLQKHFSITILVILVLNLVIFWYLLLNRKRLFHRHLHHHAPVAAKSQETLVR
jgi:uncharacterized membrane protein (DUF2068 family)